MSTWAVFVVLAVAVTMGGLVQGAVGLGLGLVAAPVATLVHPALMPGVMLWLAAAYPLLTLAREGRATDWRGLKWAFVGRLPGTMIGVAVVAVVSARLLSLFCLAVVGERALGLAPFLVLGFLLADTVRRHVDAGRTRAAVLSVCAASAVALVVRSAFG
jgi:uncharacterized membrane protein YfcA